VYHVAFGKVALWAKDLIIKTNYISLVNIIANKLVVKELIANLFTVENVSAELSLLLGNTVYRQQILEDYSIIKATLGEPGTAGRAAKKMVESLR